MIEVEPIPAFQDNYIWMLRNPGGREAWVVDPGDAAPVEAALDAAGAELAGILITHHHWDHTGGLGKLLQARDIPVFGPHNPKISGITHRYGEGDHCTVLGERMDIMETPGHTLDHIVFHAAGHVPPLLFCGDTLFAAGCGRLFEGTPQQMHASLSRLASLPADTRVFCTHEYTLANLQFAHAVEPGNRAVTERIRDTRKLREAGRPSLPSTIGIELETNPFLRVRSHEVQAGAIGRGVAADAPDAEVFGAIRAWKDSF